MASDGKKVCQKCKKAKNENLYFYTLKNGQKSSMCKQCQTLHVNAFEPNTFMWLLQKYDVPWLPPEWNNLRDRDYEKKGPKKFSHGAVFGKYLTKMKLKQFMDKSFADSEQIMKERYGDQAEAVKQEDKQAGRKLAEALDRQLEEGSISAEEYEATMPTFVKMQRGLAAEPTRADTVGTDNFFDEQKFMSSEELPNPAADLSQEDKIYLVMKWGRMYSFDELLAMQQNYHNMEQSFDIQDADSRNTLKLICKTDLKMNQAIDMGDFDGYQKLSRVSDNLRKSAKFTAAQNKKEKGEFVDSIGELVRFCEREEGFIPRFVTDVPQDKVDFTLQDMEKYLYNLVTEDLGFGQQIENYIQKIALQEKDEEKISKLDDAAIAKGEQIINDDIFDEVLQDADVADYYEEEERQRIESLDRQRNPEANTAFTAYQERLAKMKKAGGKRHYEVAGTT